MEYKIATKTGLSYTQSGNTIQTVTKTCYAFDFFWNTRESAIPLFLISLDIMIDWLILKRIALPDEWYPCTKSTNIPS